MNIQLVEAGFEEKPLLRELLNLYLYDLSDLAGTTDLNEHGRYEYRWLDNYWTEEGRHPFVLRSDGAPAGFSLVNQHAYSGAQWCISEFFVVRRHRRRGIGMRMAHDTFARLPGTWEVWTDRDNARAHTFWRRAVEAFTDGRFEERAEGFGGGPTFLFESRGEGA